MKPGLRSLRTLALACLGLCWTPPALTQAELHQVGLDSVHVTVCSPWPADMQHGYTPIFLQFQSVLEKDEQTVTVRGRSTYGRDEHSLLAEVHLPPGGTDRLTLLAPCFGTYRSHYQLEIRAEGRSKYVFMEGVSTSFDAVRKMLVFTDRGVPAGEPQRWGEYLGASSENTAGADFTVVRPEFLSPRYEAYTSIDTVIVDTGMGRPAEVQLDALLRWVRLGGKLIFHGSDAFEWADDLPGVSEWQQERFFLEEGEDFLRHRYGMGLVQFQQSSQPFGWRVHLDHVKRLLQESPGLLPRSSTYPEHLLPQIPGMTDLPRRGLTLVLLLFVLLIGPINLYVLKRMHRPTLVLVTTPSLALLTSLGMLGYGLLFQGIDLKTSDFSVTLLDQRTHVASTAVTRQFYAGLRPRGIHLGLGASCYPLHTEKNQRHRSERHYQIRQTGGVVLGGDFCPPRDPVHQLWLNDRTARQRLVLTREGADLKVENGLGVDVDKLVVCDSEGRYFQVDRTLSVGGSATAQPVNSEMSLDVTGSGEIELCFKGQSRLLPGTYKALLASNPFADHGGLEFNEIHGRHLLIGVFDVEGDS